MKQVLLMIAVVMGQSVLAADVVITNSIVEKAIRNRLNKPTGELTKTDLEKVFILELPQTEITDVSLKEVVKCKNIKLLNLDKTEITDAGLKEIAKLQQLTDLYLAGTKITAAGLKEIAKMQKLTTLFLDDTNITDAGVAEFKKALPKCTIYH